MPILSDFEGDWRRKAAVGGDTDSAERSVMHKFVARSAFWMLMLSLLTAGGCGIFIDQEMYLIPAGFCGDVFIVRALRPACLLFGGRALLFS